MTTIQGQCSLQVVYRKGQLYTLSITDGDAERAVFCFIPYPFATSMINDRNRVVPCRWTWNYLVVHLGGKKWSL